jgi:hypothetical protein
MARSEYKVVRAKARQRQQRVAAFVMLVLIAIFSLAILTGCGYGGVDVDPRDAVAVEEWEDGCDRNSPQVELKIANHSSASYEVWLFSRAGSKRRIGLVSGFEKRVKTLNRSDLEPGGTFVIRQASGLAVGGGEYHVQLGLLSCDVGYLELGATITMSQYLGMDFHPDEEFKR